MKWPRRSRTGGFLFEGYSNNGRASLLNAPGTINTRRRGRGDGGVEASSNGPSSSRRHRSSSQSTPRCPLCPPILSHVTENLSKPFSAIGDSRRARVGHDLSRAGFKRQQARGAAERVRHAIASAHVYRTVRGIVFALAPRGAPDCKTEEQGETVRSKYYHLDDNVSRFSAAIRSRLATDGHWT